MQLPIFDEEEISTDRRRESAYPPPQPGEKLGSYTILEVVSTRDSWVFKCEVNGTPYAVKMPPWDPALPENPRARREREISSRIIKRQRRAGEFRGRLVEHSPPGTVAKGEHRTRETAFLVLEWLEGPTLYERLSKESGPLPAGEAFRVAEEIAEGLSALQSIHFVHTDLKPENIKLTSEDGAKIFDFEHLYDLEAPDPGWTPPDSGRYTPREVKYFDPSRGEVPSPRSDVYSFGHVLMDLFSGLSRRASGSGSAGGRYRSLSGDRHLPARLDQLVLSCIEDEPEERFKGVPEAQLWSHVLDQLKKAQSTFETLERDGRQQSPINLETLRGRFNRALGAAENSWDALPRAKQRELLEEMRSILTTADGSGLRLGIPEADLVRVAEFQERLIKAEAIAAEEAKTPPSAEDAPRPLLVTLRRGGQETRFRLQPLPTELKVGRDASCDVVLDSDNGAISGVHLRVSREGGGWRVKSERDFFFTRVGSAEIPPADIKRVVRPDGKKDKVLERYGEKVLPIVAGAWQFCYWKSGAPPHVEVLVAATLEVSEAGQSSSPSLVFREGASGHGSAFAWVFLGGPVTDADVVGNGKPAVRFELTQAGICAGPAAGGTPTDLLTPGRAVTIGGVEVHIGDRR